MEGLQAIDKSWISLNYHDKRFRDGVDAFIGFARRHCRNKVTIPCPCKKCKNFGPSLPHDVVQVHCYQNGFMQDYLIWYLHGENTHSENVGLGSGFNPVEEQNDIEMEMDGAIKTVGGELGFDNLETLLEQSQVGRTEANVSEDVEIDEFRANFGEAMSSLYPGCEDFTVLRFVVKLFKLKVIHGWTDQSFTELLQLFRMVLPYDNKTPENTYRAEKLITKLGLNYQKIDACPNNCMLYWKEHESKISCPDCGLSRYKVATIEERKEKKKTPAKILRYFPITARLKRMYSVPWVGKEMCWHSTNRLKSGEMRHPVDSPTWKHIDRKYQDFSNEPRNVRLGLATDGFNPYGTLSSSYSSWPVMCVIYNLPPWLCMKPQFTMLALLIEGPRQPGKAFDKFLRPLVDELKTLWHNGVDVEDANTGNMFNMRAVLLWTMHDFPAYGDVSGCRTKGYLSCPCCGPETSSLRLFHGKKNVFMDFRRFLSMSDERRYDTRQGTFNKKVELRQQPLRLTGVEVDEMTKHLEVEWGMGNQTYEEENQSGSCFSKRSILFELEYWKELPIRHNLDVMHIEKNVCEILIAMMLNISKKTKDDANARKDLERLGIKEELWLPKDGGKMTPGLLWLKPDEKILFIQTLRNLKVPVGFSSNWKNLIKGDKLDLKRMKSHDYHILMQHLIPVLIQHAYKDRKQAREIILNFSAFFKGLCSKRLNVVMLTELERSMAHTLCELEKVCPPSVFVIMMHLPIHLVYEARLCGPVPYRWMFTFERMMKIFKGYVTNKARPEGCIAERYLKEETLNYCSGYEGGGSVLQKLENKVAGPTIADSDLFDGVNGIVKIGPIGGGQTYDLIGVEYEQARNWVLKSHTMYSVWIEKYQKFIEDYWKSQGRKMSRKLPMEYEFIPWLRSQPQFIEPEDVLFQDIVRGPVNIATIYNKYSINSFLFVTKESQQDRTNQNSGVLTKCVTTFRSSAKDKNPIDQPAEYYGVLKKIVQLEYRTGYRPVLFKCDWVKLTQNGVKIDADSNLKLVNLSNLLSSERMVDEPFILAETAVQVFYSQDPMNPDWHVVVEVPINVYSAENVVDSSCGEPSNSELSKNDELIFNELEDIMVAGGTKKRKRDRRN